jgi:hypothetical protein
MLAFGIQQVLQPNKFLKQGFGFCFYFFFIQFLRRNGGNVRQSVHALKLSQNRQTAASRLLYQGSGHWPVSRH